MKLPEQFLNRMKNLVPDYDQFVQAYDDNPVKSFFVNNNKVAEHEFVSNCEWDIQKYANGWKINDDIKVGKTPEHHAGMIYMQELSAMMPVSFLPLEKSDWVIDLCASPGGKSIQVANKIPDGLLVSNEIVKSRANILKSNIERMGLTNVCVTNNEPNQFEKMFGGVFDAVIVDAPCSGEGMFRKEENAYLNWSQSNIDACAVRQKAILETADKLLKQNGYILYSTCTFSVEEDEQVVADFCDKHSYDIIPLNYVGAVSGIKIEGIDTQNCLRFYPHKFQGEGQFVALLQKKENANSFIEKSKHFQMLQKFPTEYKLLSNFLKDNMFDYENILNNAIYHKGIIYYPANKQIAESGVNLINVGVVIGEIVKGRFEPNHNLVTCFGKKFLRKYQLSDDEAYKYIRGETLSCEDKGYIAVCFKDVVLGLGKGDGRTLKNHYPKGLRNI